MGECYKSEFTHIIIQPFMNESFIGCLGPIKDSNHILSSPMFSKLVIIYSDIRGG